MKLMHNIQIMNIILQIGTQNTKAGFGSQALPRITTESLMIEPDSNKNFNFEGEELFGNHNVQRQFAYNMDTSRKDFLLEDIFEKQWQQPNQKLGLKHISIKKEPFCKFVSDVVNELRDGNQAECQLLLVQPSYLKIHELNSMRNLLCQHLLDSHNLSGVYFLKSSVASCFAQGSPSGVVVDSGENFTSVSRILDGFQETSTTINFGGNCITFELQKYLKNHSLQKSLSYTQIPRSNLSELIRARQFKLIKQNIFRGKDDIESERVIQVELPDGEYIKIDKDEIIDPFSKFNEYQDKSELAFPSSYHGLSRVIVDLLEENKKKYDKTLGSFITFTGGNFLCKDILDRNCTQVIKSTEARGLGEVEFIENNHKQLSSWIGGNIVSTLPTFSSFWLSNKQWKENGASLISKKCP